MKNWRRPSFTLFALLAMLLPLLPQIAWSCPMTGRIGSAILVCAPPSAAPAKAKPHACCVKHRMQRPTAARIVKSTHAGCTNPGGPCCKLVRLPGKSHTATAPSGASFSAPLQINDRAAPLLADISNAPATLPLTFVRIGDYQAENPLSTQHFAPANAGRAPPTS